MPDESDPKQADSKSESKETFESCLDQLEKVVKELETGDLQLERSLELFEKGMALSESCRKQLEEAETRIEVLIRKDGKIQAEPLAARTMTSLDEYLSDKQRLVERELDRLVPPESEPPSTIHRAMRYSLFAGGKRIRPILCHGGPPAR